MDVIEAEKPFGTAKTNTTKGSVVDAHTELNEELLLLNAEDSTLIVVTKEGVKAFHEEANQMQSLVHKLNESREAVVTLEEKLAEEEGKRAGDPKAINALKHSLVKAKKAYEEAYAEVKKELGDKGYLSPGGGGKLMELLPLYKKDAKSNDVKPWARKWTYVRSDKIKNHIRSYKFNADELGQKKSFIRDGKVDIGELKKQFTKLEPKLKADWKVGVNGLMAPNLQAWAECLNVKADEKQAVRFSSDVHLFRYFAGCGAAVEWNPKGGKIEAKLNGKAEVMLAYGECKVEFFLPNDAGIALSITSVSGKEYLIGSMRAGGEAKVVGAAGASAAAELSVEVDYSALTSKPGIKGARRPANAPVTTTKAKLEDVAKDTGVTAGADAFAGVRASGEIKGSLQYRNPEKNNKFEDLAAIAPKVEVQFGAGAAAALMVTYKEGKFRLRAKAGVCFGPGAKGEIGLEVDAKKLVNFLDWVFHALLNAEFEFLHILAKEAFDAIVKLQVLLVSGVADAYHEVNVAWLAFEKSMAREERRVALMEAILGNPAFLRVCTPEAHGILLWQMTRHEWKTETVFLTANSEDWNFLGRRKRAVLQICRWAQCKKQFENMIQHIGQDGGKGGFTGNFAGLKRFLEWNGGDYSVKLDSLYYSLPIEPARGFPVALNDTAKFRTQVLMGGSPTYLAMMGSGRAPSNVA